MIVLFSLSNFGLPRHGVRKRGCWKSYKLTRSVCCHGRLLIRNIIRVKTLSSEIITDHPIQITTSLSTITMKISLPLLATLASLISIAVAEDGPVLDLYLKDNADPNQDNDERPIRRLTRPGRYELSFKTTKYVFAQDDERLCRAKMCFNDDEIDELYQNVDLRDNYNEATYEINRVIIDCDRFKMPWKFNCASTSSSISPRCGLFVFLDR